jgi:hypothetical protein
MFDCSFKSAIDFPEDESLDLGDEHESFASCMGTPVLATKKGSENNMHRLVLKSMTSEMTSSVDTGIGSMPTSLISNMATSHEVAAGHEDADANADHEEEEEPADRTMTLGDVAPSSFAEPPPIVSVKPVATVPTRIAAPKMAGLATKRELLLRKERIMPNLNVPSRVHTVLHSAAGSANDAAAAESKVSRKMKRSGKWDDVMDRIGYPALRKKTATAETHMGREQLARSAGQSLER